MTQFLFAVGFAFFAGNIDHKHDMTECSRICDDCARHCEMCAAHCGQKLAEGKKEHLDSHRLCADCAVVCRAASAIFARGGPMSPLMAQACAEACKKCGDACEKLAGTDAMMKDCAEHCRKCEKSCLEMVKLHTPVEKK